MAMVKTNKELELDEQQPFSVEEYLEEIPKAFKYIINNNVKAFENLMAEGNYFNVKYKNMKPLTWAKKLGRPKIITVIEQMKEHEEKYYV